MCVQRKGKTPAEELHDFWVRIEGTKEATELGRLYEQYIGYLYEEAGYEVEYTGIDKGNNDGGIDLICRVKSLVLTVQCKYRTDNAVISAKDMLQFYGAICYYSARNPNEDVSGVYYTTAQFSFDARQVADCLGVDAHDNYRELRPFPVIKCKSCGSVYYLPCDWNYSTLRMRLDKGDCYCMTIKEAEVKGFKRALL